MPEISREWWRLRISLKQWAQDALVSFLHENGCNGAEFLDAQPSHLLLAYCRDEPASRSLCQRLWEYSRALGEIHGECPVVGIELERIKDPGWAHAWKAHFRPSRLSRRLAVRPPWSSFDGPEGLRVIQIEPGQAFGTGLHETTRLCMEWLDDLLRDSPIPRTGMDLGTGTGILAMAMALLGVRQVLALDQDPLAVEAALENVRNNNLVETIQVVQGSLDAAGERLFPLVVANLTGTVLMGMARELAKRVCPGGKLLVSGILGEEAKHVAEAFRRAGMRKLGSRRRGEWRAMLLAVRK